MSELFSNFSIGDEILFQPDLKKAGTKNHNQNAIKALVVGVSFTVSKVLYDLALWNENAKEFYTVPPLKQVDSIMVDGKRDNFIGLKSE